MGKVKREVVLSQKIQIVDNKAWQVPRFQIFKVLTSTIINML